MNSKIRIKNGSQNNENNNEENVNNVKNEEEEDEEEEENKINEKEKIALENKLNDLENQTIELRNQTKEFQLKNQEIEKKSEEVENKNKELEQKNENLQLQIHVLLKEKEILMKEKAEDHKDLMKMREIFNNKQYDLKNLSERDYIKKQKDFEFYFKSKEDDYIKQISNLQNIVLEREKEIDIIKDKLLKIIHDLKFENEKMHKAMTEYLNRPKNEKRLYEFDDKGKKIFNYFDKGINTEDIEQRLIYEEQKKKILN